MSSFTQVEWIIFTVTYCIHFAVTTPINTSTNEQIHTNVSGTVQYVHNGTEVNLRMGSVWHSYTYVVAIVDRRRTTMCAGSLISTIHVLTAYHCFHGKNIKSFLLVAGSLKVDEAADNMLLWKDIAKVYRPKEYVHSNKYDMTLNDIAIVQAEEHFYYSVQVNPIKLPDQELPIGTECTIVGWGWTKKIGGALVTLQKGTVKLMNSTVCVNEFIKVKNETSVDVSYISDFTSHAVCTPDDLIKPCVGDSGGPLICDNKIYGIISFGSKECEPKLLPSVYTKVFAYNRRIRKILGKPVIDSSFNANGWNTRKYLPTATELDLDDL